MQKKLNVGVLGATGMVGQRFIQILANHPWFDVKVIAASPNSKGKTYGEAVEGRWLLDEPVPENIKGLVLRDVNEVEGISRDVDFVFSAVSLSKEEIKKIEEDYARTETPVVSNNSAHRWTPDVPMIIPEINPQHSDIIAAQRKRLGTSRGFIAVKPNCSIQSYAPALAAWREYEPYEVIVTTYQAISGAGKNFSTWPEMVGNVIPFISGEEEKSEKEPLKIFGHIEGNEIVAAKEPAISAQCIRIPVLYGHTAAAFVKFRKAPESKEVLVAKLNGFRGIPQEAKLPTAPEQFIKYFEEDNRPQVVLDVNYGHGMGVTIGRLRPDTIYDLPAGSQAWKFVGLSHNTLRGAAGGAVECAELLVKQGYIEAK